MVSEDDVPNTMHQTSVSELKGEGGFGRLGKYCLSGNYIYIF